jgi:hypothetical protein
MSGAAAGAITIVGTTITAAGTMVMDTGKVATAADMAVGTVAVAMAAEVTAVAATGVKPCFGYIVRRRS